MQVDRLAADVDALTGGAPSVPVPKPTGDTGVNTTAVQVADAASQSTPSSSTAVVSDALVPVSATASRSGAGEAEYLRLKAEFDDLQVEHEDLLVALATQVCVCALPCLLLHCLLVSYLTVRAVWVCVHFVEVHCLSWLSVWWSSSDVISPCSAPMQEYTVLALEEALQLAAGQAAVDEAKRVADEKVDALMAGDAPMGAITDGASDADKVDGSGGPSSTSPTSLS